jgi:tetratricopeptide (TPR) repeat protein
MSRARRTSGNPGGRERRAIALPAHGRAVLAAAVALCAVTLRVAAVESDAAEAFRRKIAAVSPKDAAALLDAGKWCEEHGHATWAHQCYARVVKLGDGPEFPEALFRMAQIEIARRDYEQGFARLREAAASHGHEGARAALRSAETASTREQAELAEKGDQAVARGNHKEARKLFGQAYALYPEKPAAAPFLPRKELLARIARAVDAIDDAYYQEVVQPVERSFQDCRNCTQDGGFVQCVTCKGQGTFEKFIRSGLRRKKIVVACESCQKFGWVFCKTCLGLQSYTETAKLSEKEKKAIAEVVNKVRSIKVLTLPFASALESVEGALLGIEESSTLNFFRSLKPRYKLSAALKKAIQATPPEAAGLKEGAAAWKTAEKDARIRSNFLSSYAMEFAGALRPFEMLRAAKKKADFRAPPRAAALAASGFVTPEVLAAFPEDGAAGWVAVKGTLVKYAEDPGNPFHGRLELQGDLPHNVNFFIWLPPAKARLKWFEKTSWAARLSGLGDAYAFDVRGKALAAPRGHQVTVAGRFLRDRLGFPRNWFEVWDLHVGLTREDEAALLVLRAPVDMEFQAVKLGDVARLLQSLYGLSIECPGSEDILLAVAASGAPLGLALDALARAAGLPWSYEGGTARLGGKGTARSLAGVLAELAAGSPGKLEARRVEAGVAARPAAAAGDLPGDPAALRTLAATATRDMDYARALACHDRLREQLPEGEERVQLDRARARLRLFDDLTRQTPVSALVKAKKLERITIRNTAGDRSEQTFEVLGEDARVVRARPGYGGKIAIPKGENVSRKPLDPAAWRAEKEVELRQGLLQAAERPARERTAELFLLALFAKTNGFAAEGTGILDQAIARDEFEWLCATYFPRRTPALLESWRLATGREAPAVVAPAAIAPPPPAAPALRPDEPLPDAVEDLLPFAKKHHEQGRIHLSQSLPGMEGAQEKLKLARDHFRTVQAALERMPAEKAADPEVAALRRDVGLMIQTCVKGLAFFD